MSPGGRFFEHKVCIVPDSLHLRIAKCSSIIEEYLVPRRTAFPPKIYGGETGESKTSAVSLLDVADVCGGL